MMYVLNSYADVGVRLAILMPYLRVLRCGAGDGAVRSCA
jgi:hypothetical protein